MLDFGRLGGRTGGALRAFGGRPPI